MRPTISNLVRVVVRGCVWEDMQSYIVDQIYVNYDIDNIAFMAVDQPVRVVISHAILESIRLSIQGEI